ncbi:Heterokaryon incompatibility protein (HET) domain containing protein, partial [Rhypophila decipiens]
LYQPLPPDSHHIRVAIISPGIWREVVQCELKVLDLGDESEQYEAISYCWGDEQDKATVIINGNTVPVTKSLNDALKRLRTREKKRTGWADAICINQDDLNERQQQVELMKDIYSRATEVHVFTGESLVSSLNVQSGGLFEWDEPRICRWYNDTRDLPMLQIFTRLVEMERDNDIGATCLRPQMAEICAIAILLALGKDQCFHELAAETFESPSSATWAAGISVLEDFLLQPWWLRVWVVQEVVMAKRATVHFGQCVFPSELLEDIYWKIVNHRDSGCCILSGNTVLPKPTLWMIDRLVLKVAPLVIQREADDDGFSGTLLGLLSMSRIRDASDQRDKVYGVLGLLPQGWWEYSAVEPIRPDYTKSVVSLYTEVCWKLILHSGDLRIPFA